MMEYQIDVEDKKKVQVQTIGNELVLILTQEDIEIFISSKVYNDLKKHADKLSQALVRIWLCQDDTNCSVQLVNDVCKNAKSCQCVQI